MKKTILSLFALATGLLAFAQITVNRSDYAVSGDWFFLATDTVISANSSNHLKTNGANKTWDISGWAHRHLKDTTFYADGLTFPGAPAGCNLVSFSKDAGSGDPNNLSYYFVNSTALRMIMEAGTFGGIEGGLKIFQFPSTLGTKFKDSSESFYTTLAADLGITIPFVDSLKMIFKLVNNSEVDAWGKLILDAGIFDVLRQNSKMDFTLGIKIRNTITGTYSDLPSGFGFGGMNESFNTYTWVSANGGHPLLQATEDTTGVVTEMNFMLASSRGVSSGTKENKSLTNSSRAYPVPATEQITIETQVSKAVKVSLRVYDILGNEVIPVREVEMSSGSNQCQVNLNGLKPGVYFCNMNGNGVNTTNRIVVK